MNPETGKFETLDWFKAQEAEKKGWLVLEVNEVVEIKGHKFRVKSVGETDVVLVSVKVKTEAEIAAELEKLERQRNEDAARGTPRPPFQP